MYKRRFWLGFCWTLVKVCTEQTLTWTTSLPVSSQSDLELQGDSTFTENLGNKLTGRRSVLRFYRTSASGVVLVKRSSKSQRFWFCVIGPSAVVLSQVCGPERDRPGTSDETHALLF